MRISFCGNNSFGLVGTPLGHSLSPFIHECLFSLMGIKAVYSLYETKPDSLEAFYNLTLTKLSGFNVTIPFKQRIIPLLDTLSPRAELFGSVNTVLCDNGKAEGYNTDCSGFLRALDGAGIELGGKVLILGSGGVSRMFAFESLSTGCEVTVAQRSSSLEKGMALKAEIGEKLGKHIEVKPLEQVNESYNLIINGTPAGMFPNVDESPLKRETVALSNAVFDAVYNPGETLLLKYAREEGLKYVNGLPMLVWQAAAAEEIWHQTRFEKEDINRIIAATEKELEKK